MSLENQYQVEIWFSRFPIDINIFFLRKLVFLSTLLIRYMEDLSYNIEKNRSYTSLSWVTTKGLLLYFGFECIGVLPDKKERLELKRIKKIFHAHFWLNNDTHQYYINQNFFFLFENVNVRQGKSFFYSFLWL